MAILFVYGTLKRGCGAHYLLRRAEFLGEAVTRPCYRLYDLGAYPALVEDANGVAVRGELWAVDEATLRELDEYEGAPGEFVRRPAALEPRTPARPSPAEPDGLPPAVGGGPAAEVYLFTGVPDPATDCGTCWPRAER